MKKKVLTAVILAGVLAGGICAESFVADTPKAEAGIFDKIGDAIGGKKTGIDAVDKAKDKVAKQAQDSVKGAVEKALALNVDGLQDHRKNMNIHLNMATMFYMLAAEEVRDAVGIADNSKFQEMRMMTKNIQGSSMTSLDNCYTAGSIPYPGEELKTGTEDFINKLNDPQFKFDENKVRKSLTTSKNDRVYAAIYCGLALRDAAFIVKETTKGIANISKIDSIEGAEKFANKLQDDLKFMSATAGDVKKLGAQINGRIKNLNELTKSLDKKLNIKDDKKNIEKEIKAKLSDKK